MSNGRSGKREDERKTAAEAEWGKAQRINITRVSVHASLVQSERAVGHESPSDRFFYFFSFPSFPAFLRPGRSGHVTRVFLSADPPTRAASEQFESVTGRKTHVRSAKRSRTRRRYNFATPCLSVHQRRSPRETMDLVYIPEVFTYGYSRNPQYRDYEQPWNRDYFKCGSGSSKRRIFSSLC